MGSLLESQVGQKKHGQPWPAWHLQASISHQTVALQTLRLLQQQRDRNEGQSSTQHVSTAPRQASRREDQEKGKGPEEAKLRGEEVCVPKTRDPGQCKLAHVAVHTVLAHLVEITLQLVQVEQTILNRLHQELNFPVYLKDSVELRNICSHMGQQLEGQAFDQDLNAAYQCLKTVIEKLIHSLVSLPADVPALACIAPRQVLQNLLHL
ncbi:leukemia-associated protein 7-like [Trichosurus vulpecula]|uniref:leukemia-associated protein 7-like n=1 Tax=Trichosurus vulpecula TaxID=9337 RepID=UPI00186B161E|nr:leukemia-associated protein 7-like [Trichosurus vulpecula]